MKNHVIRTIVLFLSFTIYVATAKADNHQRGFTAVSSLSAEDIQALSDWGVNVIRYQLIDPNIDSDDAAAYLDWLNQSITYLDGLLPYFDEQNIKVHLDLHTGPGGFVDKSAVYPVMKVFTDETAKQTLVDAWNIIAEHYKDSTTIGSYIMLSEPAVGSSNVLKVIGWNDLAILLAQTIRAHDTTHTIIMSPEYAKISRLSKMNLLTDYAPVSYTIHFYEPFNFTHQGLYGLPDNKSYPVKGKRPWNKAFLRNKLKGLVDFQKKNAGVKILIGEFSAVRWASGADKYFRDLIGLFEKNGWDWAYHIWRESNTWSLEHCDDRSDNNVCATEPNRAKVIKSFLEKNSQ